MTVTYSKVVRILVILVFFIVFACGMNVWAQTSPLVDDYRWIRQGDTELGLATAFSTALRINHPAAYTMIDPNLKPRLDEWMKEHQSRKCIYQADYFSSWPGTNDGRKTTFSCVGENGRAFTFNVDNIIVKNMKVVDWGEVEEAEE